MIYVLQVRRELYYDIIVFVVEYFLRKLGPHHVYDWGILYWMLCIFLCGEKVGADLGVCLDSMCYCAISTMLSRVLWDVN